METLGSILHGAYGDYYEQMLCLKHYKQAHPLTKLVLFFASEARLRELQVFDLSFADEVHVASALDTVRVDRFLQYQVKDQELQAEVLAHLPADVRAKLDCKTNLKPWTTLRRIKLHDQENDIGLSALGDKCLPACFEANNIPASLFSQRFTVGFLWRYRKPTDEIKPWFQTAEEIVRQTKSELLTELIHRFNAHILVCGMNVKTTDENRTRIDSKYTERDLNLDPDHCTYLKGLSWGLELEIMRRCSLCLVMPSGFSEALWIKRRNPTILLDAPPIYLLKLIYNRMPLFDTVSPSGIAFQSRQPHTASRVFRYLERRKLLVRTEHGLSLSSAQFNTNAWA